jgi:hypothetical protein
MTRKHSIFMDHVIAFLLPYFTHTTDDIQAATDDILATLQTYGTRTRAEMLKAAQIVALSMSTLETLSEAQTGDFSPSLRIRYRGCANGLTKSTLQQEASLDKLLACDAPGIPAEPMPEPINDLSDDETAAAIDFARIQIETYRDSLSPNPPPRTHPDLPSPEMMQAIKKVGRPIGPGPGA